MDSKIEEYSKTLIKKGLDTLPENHRVLFKRIYSFEYEKDEKGYSHPKGNQTADLTRDINEVVDNLPEDKLNQALGLIERSLERLKLNLQRKLGK